MNQFLVFPYDCNLKKILEWSDGKMTGFVEDILTMEGWGVSHSQVQIGDRKICVKSAIKDVSTNCNSIWIVESYYKVSFMTDILPVLIYAKKKHWSVFYGRSTSENEEKIIRELMIGESLHFIYKKFNDTNSENKLYNVKIPVVWIVDMFSGIPSQDMSLEMYKAFQKSGYSVGFVSKHRNISVFKGVELFPDTSMMSCHDSIKLLNHFFEELERTEKRDLFLVEIQGNLLEVSRKFYGDYGGMAYLMSKAVPPDIVICNAPYMDNIIDKKEELLTTANSLLGLPIDYLNIIPVYLDVLESEQMKKYEYVTLTDEFVDNKIENIVDIYNVNSIKSAQKLVERIVMQLNSYV